MDQEVNSPSAGKIMCKWTETLTEATIVRSQLFWSGEKKAWTVFQIYCGTSCAGVSEYEHAQTQGDSSVSAQSEKCACRRAERQWSRAVCHAQIREASYTRHVTWPYAPLFSSLRLACLAALHPFHSTPLHSTHSTPLHSAPHLLSCYATYPQQPNPRAKSVSAPPTHL